VESFGKRFEKKIGIWKISIKCNLNGTGALTETKKTKENRNDALC